MSGGLVLGQRKVAEEIPEIQAVAELLSLLGLRGCIVTLGLGSQQRLAERVGIAIVRPVNHHDIGIVEQAIQPSQDQ